MEELEKLFTIDDVARMMGFTPRTIRNYIKDGALQGRKVGAQWRFTMADIKNLFNNNVFMDDKTRKNRQTVLGFLKGGENGLEGKNQVCAIIDCACEDQKAGQKIYEKLVSVINNKKDKLPARFDYEFRKEANKARFYLLGSPDFVAETLQKLG